MDCFYPIWCWVIKDILCREILHPGKDRDQGVESC